MNPARLLDWAGTPCVVMASGPSLDAAQIETVRKAREAKPLAVIAVNSTVFQAPWTDVVYACDFLWWRLHHAAIVKQTTAACWTQDRTSAERFHINWVRQAARPGLGAREKGVLQVNGNSGTGAIGLAYLFGCRRILLAGFDMQLGPKGEKHHHADHPHPLVQKSQFGEWIHKLDTVARDLKTAKVEVINCSKRTALNCFPKSTLEKELPC